MNSIRIGSATMRLLLAAGIALLAIGPLLFLLVLSTGEGWFWPQLIPARFDTTGWMGIVDGPAGPRLADATRNSLMLGTGTALISSLLSLPAGRALSRLDGWKRAVGAAAAFLPVAAPPIALGVGLQYTFLLTGLAGSFAGVLLAHLIPAIGYTSLFFMGFFLVHDDRLDEAARTLGASPHQLFLRVTLPMLRRPLVEAALLGFLISWAQVPLTLLIGQGLVPTLPVELLTYVRAGQDRLAAAGAVLLILPGILALTLAGLAIRQTETVAV